MHFKWTTHCALLVGMTLGTAVWESPIQAADVRVLPAGTKPADTRLGPLKDLNGHFPFRVPDSVEAWEQRRSALRQRILVATGLWPMIRKTPLNAVIHNRVERDGFTVESVYFESVPGHFVTGLLFRPVGKTGKLPAVLSPHGHGGRLQDHGAKKIRELIVEGRERFEDSGRYPKLARCAGLARMGCVVFLYDMLGYADSTQIPMKVAHRFKAGRPHLEQNQRWGFFTAQAELRLQSIMGLQTYNSIRGLDFLQSLPDVDPQRIAVTGGSGGGTQTILLCAIDPRPVVAFPQGMVSTAMQGGCVCENASLLRIGTGNVELAALFAPRPLGMTAADDWTRDMMTDGYPQLQQLYEMLGAKDRVTCKSLLHFPHNYNYVTRAVMYDWFNKHLELGLETPIVEEDFRPLEREEQSVWNDEHPQPPGGEEYEVSLTAWLDQESQQQLAALLPADAESLETFREVVGGAFRTILGPGLPQPGTVQRTKIGKHDWGSFIEMRDLLHHEPGGRQLPVVWLWPEDTKFNGELVVWLAGGGKQDLFADTGLPVSAVRNLLREGYAVAGIDLFMQGEYVDAGEPVRNRVNNAEREAAAYTYGYNHSVFTHRVQDVATLVTFARDQDARPRVHLVGADGMAPVAAAAATQLGDAIDRRVLDMAGFRFRDLESYRDPQFVTGAVKYGDIPSLLALAAPHETWVGGEAAPAGPASVAAYAATGAAENLHWTSLETDELVWQALIAPRASVLPFAGKLHEIPGRIEAEHYDQGPPGQAYHDNDVVNQGADYRGETQVDIEKRDDASNGHGIGWTREGEWVQYTAFVRESGAYEIEMPVASNRAGGQFHLEIDRRAVTGPIHVPDTGSWQKLKHIKTQGVRLTRGIHTITVKMDRNGDSGSIGDIDYFEFRRQ